MLIGAIDIGGTKTMVALVDESGKILNSHKFESVSLHWETHFKMTIEAFENCARKLCVPTEELQGIGVNMPGIVDEKKGVLIFAPFQNWTNIPVGEQFKKALRNKNVKVENDVNACAIGEMLWGGARATLDHVACREFAWITVSTGNGGALVTNGQLARGHNSSAGEFGHLKVEFEDGRSCKCGQYGCLEAYSSGTAIGQRLKELIKKNEDNHPFDDAKVDAFYASILCRDGYPPAEKIYEEAGKYLGRALSYICNISNPDKIFIGGGVAASLDLLLPSMKKEMEQNTLKTCGNVEILRTQLGYEAAILGAAALILR